MGVEGRERRNIAPQYNSIIFRGFRTKSRVTPRNVSFVLLQKARLFLYFSARSTRSFFAFDTARVYTRRLFESPHNCRINSCINMIFCNTMNVQRRDQKEVATRSFRTVHASRSYFGRLDVKAADTATATATTTPAGNGAPCPAPLFERPHVCPGERSVT